MEQLPLFVYGTLMSDQPAFPRFAHASICHVSAQLSDIVLHSVGRYPIAADGAGVLHGELHWLSEEQYTQLLNQLDEYEGDEYVRVQRQATVMSGAQRGQIVTAWIYLGTAEYAATFPRLISGDWRKRVVRADG